jgi:hypothetical protein
MSALQFGWRYFVGSKLHLFAANRLLSSKGRKVELLGALEELLYSIFPCNRNPRSLSLIFISFADTCSRKRVGTMHVSRSFPVPLPACSKARWIWSVSHSLASCFGCLLVDTGTCHDAPIAQSMAHEDSKHLSFDQETSFNSKRAHRNLIPPAHSPAVLPVLPLSDPAPPSPPFSSPTQHSASPSEPLLLSPAWHSPALLQRSH